MKFDKFKENVIGCIRAEYPDALDVTVKEVLKNNGVVLNGVTVVFEDENISPTVYIDDMYKRYLEGEELSILFKSLIDTFEGARIKDSFDASFICDYEQMKDRILCKLINREKNATLLQGIPYIEKLDLAIVFYCVVDAGISGTGTVLIRNEMHERYGVTVEELYERARKNTVKQMQASITSIEEVLFSIINANPATRIDESDIKDMRENSCPMYVLTNKTKCFGAASLLDEELLRQFADRVNGDFFILPSSVHELILVPVKDVSEAEGLENIVREVNANELDATDFLSDYVYRYMRNTRTIVRC